MKNVNWRMEWEQLKGGDIGSLVFLCLMLGSIAVLVVAALRYAS